MVKWLTPRTPDSEVRGSNLAGCVVSVDKKLYSTLSLFTQVYKCIPVTYCLGRVTLRWTSNPSRGNSSTFRHEDRDKRRTLGPLARVRLYLLSTCSYLTFILYVSVIRTRRSRPTRNRSGCLSVTTLLRNTSRDLS